MNVVPLSEATNVKYFGGKAANLAKMLQAGLPVPDGFVIPATTYQKFNQKMPKELEDELQKAFDELGAKRVAVRSSALAEDSTKASWAGQLETVLNVTRETLVEAVEYCWASMQSRRAQTYAKENKITTKQQAVAVLVQTMVDSDISGVLFTANPITNNKKETVIEAIYGLGELLVQGIVTPESYTIDSKTGKVITHAEHRQTTKLVFQNGTNTEVKVKQPGPILAKQQLQDLLKQSKRIEQNFKAPQDIEFAFEGEKLYIVQSRPITTLKKSVELPDFFHNVVKTIARPGSLQRDEIVRYTANKVQPVEVVTIPLEGTNRAYYLEAENAKKLLQKCIQATNSIDKLHGHLKDYETVEQRSEHFKELVASNARDYQAIFKNYFVFLDVLSPFLYVGVAVDKIIYPKFKTIVDTKYPKASEEILEIVATPQGLHDYQKQRLAICELVPKYKKDPAGCAEKISEIVKNYEHVNEYTFVEPLTTKKDIVNELETLTLLEAKAEAHDILGAVEANQNYHRRLAELLDDEDLVAQALLIKEYALLRTDRIDRLKFVQVQLRHTFKQLAQDFKQKDGKPWALKHVANLLTKEINDYIKEGQLPTFVAAVERIDQRYLYYYTDNQPIVEVDPKIVAEAKSIIVKSDNAQSGSLISPGTTAHKGIASGRVVKINSLDDLKRVRLGDIMVARVTMPDYTAVMKRAAGFITAEGGITSHAAIVARELSKPCIVGSDTCMEVLKDGDFISLDSTNQIVQYTDQHNFDLGKPSELFYWGPSRAKPLYMSDFMAAIEKFFVDLTHTESLPTPPKTMALFYNGKVVWLINALAFNNFTQALFMAYKKRDKLKEDKSNWLKITNTPSKLPQAWGHTLFAEFSLYGAESVLAEKLK